MKQREMRASKNQYNIIKKKLEELTNLSYPDLKDEATLKKRKKEIIQQIFKGRSRKRPFENGRGTRKKRI
jgi:hypothetical protein